MTTVKKIEQARVAPVFPTPEFHGSFFTLRSCEKKSPVLLLLRENVSCSSMLNYRGTQNKFI